MRIRLTLNGERRDLEVPENMPVLWLLRDELALTGTKFGCGIGACGACTVHVNGQATRSCTMTAQFADQKSITTIEGLRGELADRVRDAWIAEDVAQCGYCQAGQIMTATFLLQRNARPSDSEIDAAMSAHICRCGTYERIRKAIHRAASAKP